VSRSSSTPGMPAGGRRVAPGGELRPGGLARSGSSRWRRLHHRHGLPPHRHDPLVLSGCPIASSLTLSTTARPTSTTTRGHCADPLRLRQRSVRLAAANHGSSALRPNTSARRQQGHRPPRTRQNPQADKRREVVRSLSREQSWPSAATCQIDHPWGTFCQEGAVGWPGDAVVAGLAWDRCAGFLAAAGFGPPRGRGSSWSARSRWRPSGRGRGRTSLTCASGGR
jgi:hypothetical protein